MKPNGGILLTGNVYFSEVSKLESKRSACPDLQEHIIETLTPEGNWS